MISLCSFREEEDSLTAKKVGYWNQRIYMGVKCRRTE